MLENGMYMTDNLRAFLNEYDMLIAFENNVASASSSWKGSPHELSIISGAFAWLSSPEGEGHWLKLHEEWHKELRRRNGTV